MAKRCMCLTRSRPNYSAVKDAILASNPESYRDVGGEALHSSAIVSGLLNLRKRGASPDGPLVDNEKRE
jgi:hypothetical protein